MSKNSDSKPFSDWNGTPPASSYWDGFFEYHANDIYSPDTNNRTVIWTGQDADFTGLDTSYWMKLDSYQSGSRNLEWVNYEYVTYYLNRHTIEAMYHQLDLSAALHGEAKRWFMGIDLSKRAGRRKGYGDLAAFSICAVLVNKKSKERDYHPNQLDENKDPYFRRVELCLDSALGFDKSSIRKSYGEYEAEYRKKLVLDYSYQRFERAEKFHPMPPGEEGGI
ncbi:hypothetical protein [Halobaculum sp. D14]|uniref:hypothetical protein n=1 Tax=Halobaculum sp. D14 TaxID=3421642 RepID=UPI003EBF2201